MAQARFPAARRSRSTGRRVQGGVASTDLILSARVGSNAAVFADLLRLHVPEGSLVADVTYGRGAFWREVPDGAYRVAASDLRMGVDCTRLPYADGSFDAVVLDPPYMEGLFRPLRAQLAGSGTHAPFRERYSCGAVSARRGPKYHEAVLDLYYRAGAEAHRVLRPRGVLIVKCQDEVSAGKQRLTHVELLNHYADRFDAKDLFVVVRAQRPCVSRIERQLHARKNHSYFLVLIARELAAGHPNVGAPRTKRRPS
jgi:SAM-dependent methyltransferase